MTQVIWLLPLPLLPFLPRLPLLFLLFHRALIREAWMGRVSCHMTMMVWL
jgi:hypothetical protein